MIPRKANVHGRYVIRYRAENLRISIGADTDDNELFRREHMREPTIS